MIARAQARFIRISPKKARQLTSLLKTRTVNEAFTVLSLFKMKSSVYINKILNSAVTSAKIKGFNAEQLYISKIIVENGPIWKRYRAVAFGRANEIKKRTSHIKIELDIVNK